MLRMVNGEVHYPAGAGRVLTQDVLVYVEGPFEGWQSMRFVAFAVDGFVLLGWRSGFTVEEARNALLDDLRARFGMEVVA